MDEELARAWVAAITVAVRSQADRLTELDTAIGDGDHGVNLRRGFDAAAAAVDSLAPGSAGDVLGKTGTTLLSKVGGASGPLYGTVFRALGKTLRAGGSLAEGLQAALDGRVSGASFTRTFVHRGCGSSPRKKVRARASR
ncbi:DAK2 domain-containing protein, partial [Dactylosporangium sp. NPDC051485]|uniref:DAK2 domain-containing protein n=1 Tax=Dactylosporangium sp. NPDC051485 TaxID=3154846 RepID=UPI0034173830